MDSIPIRCTHFLSVVTLLNNNHMCYQPTTLLTAARLRRQQQFGEGSLPVKLLPPLQRPKKPPYLESKILNPVKPTPALVAPEKKYNADQYDNSSVSSKMNTDFSTTTPALVSPENKSNADQCDNISFSSKPDIDLCSLTDVLRLLDSLQLPIEDELYLFLIKECTESSDVSQGTIIHSHIQKNRRHLLRQPTGLALTNNLLLMFATCGNLETAYQLFEQMLLRDATSWATMAVALSSSHEHRGVLRLFVNMCTSWGMYRLLREPSCYWLDVFVSVFRSCAQVRELNLAQQIHGLAFKMLGGSDVILSSAINNALVQLYSIVGQHYSAMKVFRRMDAQNAATWTRMITDYTRIGQFQEAIDIFREMMRLGRSRNFHVFSSSLVACGKVRDKGYCGKQVHACAVKSGVDYDQFVGTSLVTMYINHGLLSDANRAFELIDGVKDAACWNSLILGYARNRCDREAIRLFIEMKASGIKMKQLMVNDIFTALGHY